MNLDSEQQGPVLLVTTNDSRIDASVAIQFKDRMRDLTVGKAARIVLDLGSVSFVDSSGLGAIVAVMKQLDKGQKLELASLTPAVEKVFRLTRMDSVFTIHADTAAALGNATADAS